MLHQLGSSGASNLVVDISTMSDPNPSREYQTGDFRHLGTTISAATRPLAGQLR